MTPRNKTNDLACLLYKDVIKELIWVFICEMRCITSGMNIQHFVVITVEVPGEKYKRV
jgi:hypothetical protein